MSADGWSDPDNLVLGDTTELIRDLNAELGNPVGAKKARRAEPVDLAAHMARLRNVSHVMVSAYMPLVPGAKWFVNDHDVTPTPYHFSEHVKTVGKVVMPGG